MYNLRRRRHRYVTLEGVKHVGTIVNNEDPLKQERVQVRISGIHDQVPDADLPWITARRSGQAQQQQAGSVGNIPGVGTNVEVGYDDETMYFGRYHGPTTTNSQKPYELFGGDQTGKDYPWVEDHIDMSGTRITKNRKRDTVDIEHKSGTFISVDGMGNIAIKHSGQNNNSNAMQNHSPGITIEAQGDISFNAKGTLTMGANTIKVISKGELHHLAGSNMYVGANGDIYHKKPIIANPSVPQVNAPAAPTQRTRPSISAPTDPTSGSSSGA